MTESVLRISEPGFESGLAACFWLFIGYARLAPQTVPWLALVTAQAVEGLSRSAQREPARLAYRCTRASQAASCADQLCGQGPGRGTHSRCSAAINVAVGFVRPLGRDAGIAIGIQIAQRDPVARWHEVRRGIFVPYSLVSLIPALDLRMLALDERLGPDALEQPVAAVDAQHARRLHFQLRGVIEDSFQGACPCGNRTVLASPRPSRRAVHRRRR